MMLKRIVMRLNGVIMVQFTLALGWLKEQLWKPVSNLLVNFTRLFLNAIVSPLVNTAQLQSNALVVKMKLVRLLTNASKTALILIQRLWIRVGLKFHDNATQPQQRAKSVRKRVKRLAKAGSRDK
jgi:hypothetical protein